MLQNGIKVSIGIQARSTSERLPNKIMADLAGKPMAEWTLEAAHNSAFYLSKPRNSVQYTVNVFMLMPYKDAAIPYFSKIGRVIEGDEFDVLSRYYNLGKLDDSDYIVRLTSDCPLIQPALISKAINISTINKYDYFTNAYEFCRTAPDGYDVEVISRKMINYLFDNTTEKSHREHVTTFIREGNIGKGFRIGALEHELDLSSLKLSVDTEEDLENLRERKREQINKHERMCQILGKSNVHKY